MATYRAVKNYFDSFVNYEKNVNFCYRRALQLKRVTQLFKILDIPYKSLKVIHIAGTKGKGSTATVCAYTLAALGYRVGLYTSPHIIDVRERIALVKRRFSCAKDISSLKNKGNPFVSQTLISSRDMVTIAQKIRVCLETMHLSASLGDFTFFEVYTALALLYFVQKNVDYIILETGLGGRLDATNVVRSIVSVITHVGYDHTDKLGRTLTKIAYEKAGIIKRYTCVVSAPQRKSVEKVLKDKCRKEEAPLYLYGRDFAVKSVVMQRTKTQFDFVWGSQTMSKVPIALRGACQVENVAVALAAVMTVAFDQVIAKQDDVKKALLDVSLPGRFEMLSRDPLVVLDGAHNLSSFAAVNANLKYYFPSRKVIFIFAACRDKDVQRMVRMIDYEYLILTQFNHERGFSADELKQSCKVSPAAITASIAQAYQIALKLYKRHSLILISGSFFLVSEARQNIRDSYA